MTKLPRIPKHRLVTARLVGEKIFETPDGTCREWRRDGKRHREDGPAVEWIDGHKEWWRDGQRHRDSGPAVEWANGDKSWWRNGELHREDGPAVEGADGRKQWWRNGKRQTRKKQK